MIFDTVVEEIEYNRNRKLEGKDICIDWPFETLNDKISGIQKSKYYLVTGGKKAGKTQITDYLFVINPLLKILRGSNLKIKIIYFTLEISASEKVYQLICYFIFYKYKRVISPEELKSMFKGKTLSEDDLGLVKSLKRLFEVIEQNIVFVEHVKNPYGMYKTVKDYMETIGTAETKKIVINDKIEEVVSKYTPNDEDQYVFVVTDHISLLTPEKANPTLHESITKWSSDYCLKLRDKYKCTIINVQQQALDKEKPTINPRTGEVMSEKFEPSADGLGDCKLTSRDCNMMIGCFSPYMFNLEKHRGYNITKFKDNYRQLSVVLNRNGISNIYSHLFFQGQCNHFNELPNANDLAEQYK